MHAGVPKGEQIPKNVLKIVITLLNFITAGTDLKIIKKNNENNTASRIIVRPITWSSFGISTAAVKPERGRKGSALTW